MCCTVVRTRVWGEKSGSTTHIWYCCYCGDGPIGLWIPSCPLCGHKRCGGTILHNELAPTVSLGPQYSRNLIAAPTTISEIGAVHDPKRSSLSQDFKASFSSLPGNGKKRTSVPDANKTSNSIDRSFNSGHYTPLSNILPDEEDELMKRGDSADDEEPSDPECEYGTPQGSEFSPVGYTGIELLIRKRANHLACRISNLLQFIIDPEAGIIRCTSGTRAGSSTPKAGGGCSTKKASSVQHSKWGAKPSQRRKATTERESDQDDEQEERRLFKKRKIPVETNIPRLACIFWKRKRQKCRHRSCAGPGWSTIHHLREHLQRRHRVFQCPRCSQYFLHQQKLEDHKQLGGSCQEREMRQPFGINEGNWPRIAQRIKGGTKEEQWKSWFHICFPNVPESRIPSPYYTKDDENDLDDDFDDFGSPSLEDFVEYCGGHLPRLVHSELEQAFRLDLTNAVNTRSQQLNDLIGARDLKDLLDNSIQRGLQRCRSSFASYIQTQNTPDSVSDTPQSSPRATSQSQFPSHPSIRATPAPILSQTWDNVTLETDIRDFRLEETLDYWAWAPIEPLEASSEDNFRLPAFPANDPFVPNVGGLLEGPDISIQQPQATSYFHQDNIAPVSPPIQPQSFHQDQIMPSNQPIQPQTLPLNPVNSQAGLSIADHPHSGKAVGTRSAQIPIDKQGPVNYESSSSGAVDAFFDGPNIQRYFRS